MQIQPIATPTGTIYYQFLVQQNDLFEALVFHDQESPVAHERCPWS